MFQEFSSCGQSTLANVDMGADGNWSAPIMAGTCGSAVVGAESGRDQDEWVYHWQARGAGCPCKNGVSKIPSAQCRGPSIWIRDCACRKP
ncbi:hypothetical protein RHIZ404_220896 [Rhizobium sp. EC-SD404]|nr:hypothetical protein RHIZ404_220896 [Rhizobium sp. EC-SD404]